MSKNFEFDSLAERTARGDTIKPVGQDFWANTVPWWVISDKESKKVVFSSELNMAGNALVIFLIKSLVVSLDRRLIACKFGQKKFWLGAHWGWSGPETARNGSSTPEAKRVVARRFFWILFAPANVPRGPFSYIKEWEYHFFVLARNCQNCVFGCFWGNLWLRPKSWPWAGLKMTLHGLCVGLHHLFTN